MNTVNKLEQAQRNFEASLKRADKGDAASQLIVGLNYLHGSSSVEKDQVKGFIYLKLAADYGNCDAQYYLGLCYQDGTGCDIDYSLAFKYYTMAAQQGHAFAYCRIGELYGYGRGVEPSNVKAAYFYQKAADLDHPLSQVIIGICYWQGDGVAKNPLKAFSYFEKAAEQDHPHGHFYLAMCYEQGIGVKQDLELAQGHYIQAQELGFDLDPMILERVQNELDDNQGLADSQDLGHSTAHNVGLSNDHSLGTIQGKGDGYSLSPSLSQDATSPFSQAQGTCYPNVPTKLISALAQLEEFKNYEIEPLFTDEVDIISTPKINDPHRLIRLVPGVAHDYYERRPASPFTLKAYHSYMDEKTAAILAQYKSDKDKNKANKLCDETDESGFAVPIYEDLEEELDKDLDKTLDKDQDDFDLDFEFFDDLEVYRDLDPSIAIKEAFETNARDLRRLIGEDIDEELDNEQDCDTEGDVAEQANSAKDGSKSSSATSKKGKGSTKAKSRKYRVVDAFEIQKYFDEKSASKKKGSKSKTGRYYTIDQDSFKLSSSASKSLTTSSINVGESSDQESSASNEVNPSSINVGSAIEQESTASNTVSPSSANGAKPHAAQKSSMEAIEGTITVPDSDTYFADSFGRYFLAELKRADKEEQAHQEAAAKAAKEAKQAAKAANQSTSSKSSSVSSTSKANANGKGSKGKGKGAKSKVSKARAFDAENKELIDDIINEHNAASNYYFSILEKGSAEQRYELAHRFRSILERIKALPYESERIQKEDVVFFASTYTLNSLSSAATRGHTRANFESDLNFFESGRDYLQVCTSTLKSSYERYHGKAKSLQEQLATNTEDSDVCNDEHYRLLKAAANDGDAAAQYELSNLYRGGKFLKKKYPKDALKYLALAAKNGYVHAQVGMAQYYGSVGKHYNLKKSLTLYHKAALQGDVYSQEYLAKLYYEGKIVEQNLIKASLYQTMLAIKGQGLSFEYVGSILAKANLSKLSCYPYRSAPLNLVEQKARDEDQDALIELATRYQKGQGVEQEPLIAITLLDRPVKAYYAQALVQYGAALILGKGMLRDLNNGTLLLMIAAFQGSVEAMCLLGSYYLSGVLKDDESNSLGLGFYSLAARLNHKRAALTLTQLYQQRLNLEEQEAFKLGANSSIVDSSIVDSSLKYAQGLNLSPDSEHLASFLSSRKDKDSSKGKSTSATASTASSFALSSGLATNEDSKSAIGLHWGLRNDSRFNAGTSLNAGSSSALSKSNEALVGTETVYNIAAIFDEGAEVCVLSPSRSGSKSGVGTDSILGSGSGFDSGAEVGSGSEAAINPSSSLGSSSKSQSADGSSSGSDNGSSSGSISGSDAAINPSSSLGSSSKSKSADGLSYGSENDSSSGSSSGSGSEAAINTSSSLGSSSESQSADGSSSGSESGSSLGSGSSSDLGSDAQSDTLLDAISNELMGSMSPDLSNMIYCYNLAANVGYTPALMALGKCFDEGKIVAQDYHKAFAYFKKAAEASESMALCIVGNCYLQGRMVAKDFNKAVEYFEQAVSQGSAVGNYLLGNCYALGLGVKQDMLTAFIYYQRALEGEYYPALTKLGRCYQYGHGVKRNITKAVEYYEQGYERKIAQSCFYLGECYLHEPCKLTGARHDKDKLYLAREAFEMAASLHYLPALYALAQVCEEGGVEGLNIIEAIIYHNKALYLEDKEATSHSLCDFESEYLAPIDHELLLEKHKIFADQGKVDSQIYVATCYFEGMGVEQDIQEAFKYFKMAAEHNHPVALFKLGRCYKQGLGVDKDLDEAIKCYKLAADLGNDGAQCNLGICYKRGEGVKEDLKKPIKYLKLSAAQGNVAALNNLGLYYLQGTGVDEDQDQAISYYQQSAMRGSVSAIYNLANIYHGMKRSSISQNYAFMLYELGAQLGHVLSTVCLGKCYLKGHGVEIDFDMAEHYFEIAAKEGNDEAKNELLRLKWSLKISI